MKIAFTTAIALFLTVGIVISLRNATASEDAVESRPRENIGDLLLTSHGTVAIELSPNYPDVNSSPDVWLTDPRVVTVGDNTFLLGAIDGTKNPGSMCYVKLSEVVTMIVDPAVE